jgi:hypothetical protein
MQKSFGWSLAALLLLWSAAMLQAQAGPSGAPAAGAQGGANLAAGAVLGAELSKSVDAKKAKVGQEVVAKSLGDLRDNSGNVVIPHGSKLVGHVTTVKAASKQDPQSSLGIIFDKVEVKQGKETKDIGMHAAIQALEKPQPSPMMQEQEPPGAGSQGGQGGSPSGGGQPSMGPSGGGRTAGGASGSQRGDMGGGNMGEQQQGQATDGGAPTLNGNSRGVIGNSNLTLSPQASPTEGAVISSTHGNVKLDSGTLLVLRVISQ